MGGAAPPPITRDADFLGFGSAELPHIEAVFREICTIETHDGVAFQPDTVHAAEIRKEANYAGVRVMLLGVIDGARCQIHQQYQQSWVVHRFRIEQNAEPNEIAERGYNWAATMPVASLYVSIP